MDFTEIIAAIQGSSLENKADVIKALNDHVNGITTEAENNKTQLQQELDAVLEAVGTGEGTLKQRVKTLVNSIEELTKKLESTQTQLTEKETAYQELERTSTIKEAASIVGLNSYAALSELLKPEDKLEIKNGKVLVNDKDYENWVKEDKSAFTASLIPQEKNNVVTSGGINSDNAETPRESAFSNFEKNHTWGVSK